MRNTRVHELLPALQRAASGRRLSADATKARLAARVESRSGAIVELCRALVRIDSTNPPGDTTAMVEAIEAVLDGRAGIEHRRVVGRAPAVNLVARGVGVADQTASTFSDNQTLISDW